MQILYTYPKTMNVQETPAYHFISKFNAKYIPNERGGYYDILFDMWKTPDTYIILEHDKVPDVHTFIHMILCKEPLCVARYKFNPNSLRDGVQYVQRIVTDQQTLKTRDTTNDDKYCDMYGFGLIKIGKYVIEHIDLPRMMINRTMYGVDTQLSKITMGSGYRGHLHPEIQHLH